MSPLEEAERDVRHEVALVGEGIAYVGGPALVLVLAELDRLRRESAGEYHGAAGLLVNAEASDELDRLRVIERRVATVRDSASGTRPVVDPDQGAAIHSTASLILDGDA